MGKTNRKYSYPDTMGHFGDFGGRYVSETLMPALIELQKAYEEASADKTFHEEDRLLPEAVRRAAHPSLLRARDDGESRRREDLP